MCMQDMRLVLLSTIAVARFRRASRPLSRRFQFQWRLPNFHRPVEAGRRDPIAIRAEVHALNPARVTTQDMGFHSWPVPDFHGAVGAAPRQPLVWAEGHALGCCSG